MPGRRTSRIKQLGPSVRLVAKNSDADANTSTLNPTERTKLLRAARTDASSSMTKTTGGTFAAVGLGVIRLPETSGTLRGIFDNSLFHARLAVAKEGKPNAILSSVLLPSDCSSRVQRKCSPRAALSAIP